MIRNYIKIAFRNLWNKKVYTGINLLGLSIASAFCLLVYMYAKEERSFDRFHKNAARLYRLEQNQRPYDADEKPGKKGFFSFLATSDETTRYMLVQPFVLGADLKNSFPEIENVIRYHSMYRPTIRWNNQSYRLGDENSAFVEKNFFTVFDFPLVQGNAGSVLSSPNNVVINERLAKRVFGNLNPIGQTIVIPDYNNLSLTISGVAKNFPTNSSMDYEMVIPLEADPNYAEQANDHSNNHSNTIVLLQLKKNANVDVFQKKLEGFSKEYFAAAVREWREFLTDKNFEVKLSIRPFSEAHYNVSTPWGHYTNFENIYQLVALAIVILLIACVNYILLTLTNTVSRSQEVGVRKTMGAGRKHIIFQFLCETQLLVTFAFAGGLILCISCIPVFNALTGANIDVAVFSFKDFAIAALGLFFVLGLLAGFYPALIMSGMRPLNMLRKFSSVKLSPVLSRALVIVQYSACILLIISSLVISRQMHYINRMQLGFDKEQVMLIENPYDYGDPQRKTLPARMAQYASTEPAIGDITCNDLMFGYGGGNINHHIINDKGEMIHQLPVDYNFFDFMKIPIIKGRAFQRNMPTDSMAVEVPKEMQVENSSSARRAIIVNETLYNMLGKPELGVINRPMGGRIIGVCGNFHFINSTQAIPPAYMMIGKWGFRNVAIRIKAGQHIPDVIDRIKANWSRITNNQVFSFSFLDEEVKKQYESYTLWLKIINIATMLAVMIACMGLFGLSALYAVNRTKEIGIRKVMGASVADIFVLLNQGIVKLAIISFIIAIPLSIYFMNSWLQNFTFRIHLNWIFFVVAGAIGVVLAVAAVSYHSLKASMSNPVDSLRTE